MFSRSVNISFQVEGGPNQRELPRVSFPEVSPKEEKGKERMKERRKEGRKEGRNAGGVRCRRYRSPLPPSMARLHLALAPLLAYLASVLGAERTFLQVTVPHRVPSYATVNTEQMTFNIHIGGKVYTIHLNQQSFLAHDFRVYTYNHAGAIVSFLPSLQRDCFYQGYVDGFADALVVLNTCGGLSGLMQLDNITYGIEPVDSASGFQHLIYQIEYNDGDLQVTEENYSIHWGMGMSQRTDSETPINFSTMRYVEMHIVVAKDLCDFMGSTEDAVTARIVEVTALVNAMFSKLNVKIVLSSLELWVNRDKIPTTGSSEDLLEEFVRWKQAHLILRPHDVAFLFIFRSKIESVGSIFAKNMCMKPSSTGVAMYQKGITLETFSVIVGQLLGFSLGLHFDNARECHCPVATCLMDTKAIRSSGVKAFSSCSVKDYRNFLGYGTAQCLLNKPHIEISYRAPTCGNKIVEDGEECDCGSMKECEDSNCCESDCTLKKGKDCAHGECCVLATCKVKAKGTVCRDIADADCDLKEYCNGTSPLCTADFYVEDGQTCDEDKGVCMTGVCQSSDQWCRQIFGKDSKSGTSQCYEEINSQRDRMGHCGSSARGYESCQWQDLKCGKLVCLYTSKKPFTIENAAIIYAKVKNQICVTLDYMKGLGVKDPFLVHDGASCGKDKICMNQKCVDRSVIKLTCNTYTDCNNRGKCNNRGNCHCDMGWAPPDCRTREEGGLGGSIDSSYRSGSALLAERRRVTIAVRNWLLISFFLFLPVIIGSAILIVKLRDIFSGLKVEEEIEDEGEETEGSRSQDADQSENASV
ncbi:disintegrin and metalloproteinase domain-containing protein 2-like [Anolis sagrei]|uniref:disintegrin and metalloproteinase domain-containing protein 2-like n=1 Tax=Anolis sagrei TaxID=38937 RepID=UPI00352057E6